MIGVHHNFVSPRYCIRWYLQCFLDVICTPSWKTTSQKIFPGSLKHFYPDNGFVGLSVCNKKEALVTLYAAGDLFQLALSPELSAFLSKLDDETQHSKHLKTFKSDDVLCFRCWKIMCVEKMWTLMPSVLVLFESFPGFVFRRRSASDLAHSECAEEDSIHASATGHALFTVQECHLASLQSWRNTANFSTTNLLILLLKKKNKVRSFFLDATKIYKNQHGFQKWFSKFDLTGHLPGCRLPRCGAEGGLDHPSNHIWDDPSREHDVQIQPTLPYWFRSRKSISFLPVLLLFFFFFLPGWFKRLLKWSCLKQIRHVQSVEKWCSMDGCKVRNWSK